MSALYRGSKKPKAPVGRRASRKQTEATEVGEGKRRARKIETTKRGPEAGNPRTKKETRPSQKFFLSCCKNKSDHLKILCLLIRIHVSTAIVVL